MITQNRKLAPLGAAVAVALVPPLARAQLEEVTVTAQRRTTSLQDTPISIQAFTGEDLEVSGIEAGQDLDEMTPNLIANPSGGGGSGATQFYVRGLPGVGVYIDGVWQGPFGFQQMDFVEIERIEVLRGPQGTLFGRNTNGGAINITTQRPAAEFGARMDFEVGEFNRRNMTLAVDVPISDTLKTKWMGASLENDGFLDSEVVPWALGGRDDTLLRADVLWEPTDNFSLRVTANDEDKTSSLARIVRFTDETNFRQRSYNVILNNPDVIALAGPDFEPRDVGFGLPSADAGFTPEKYETNYPGGQLGKWETRSDTPEDGTITDVQYMTMTADWDITDSLHLRSITSGWQMERRSVTDFDGSEFTITTDDYRRDDENFTQEFHLEGTNLNGRIDWLAGFYYLDQTQRQRFYRWAMYEFAIPTEGSAPPPNNAERERYVRDWAEAAGIPVIGTFPATFFSDDALTQEEDEDKAFFGEVTVGATDRLDLTFGVRITADEGRSITYTPTSGFRAARPDGTPAGDPLAGIVDTVEVDPDLGNITTNKFAAQYEVSEDIMLYGSWGEGFTSGGVTIDENFPEPIILDPEIVTTREFGLRSDLLDGRLRFNATYFDSDWDGLRVPILPPPDPETGVQPPFPVNTSEGLAQADGWEFEVVWAPGERWQFNAGVGLINTEYLELGDVPEDGNGLQPGLPFAYAPETSASLGLRYELPLANGSHLLFAGNYGWKDKYIRDPANQRIPQQNGRIEFEPSYGLLNARVRLESADARWHLEFWGRNLTDEWYVNGGFDARNVWGYDFAVIGRSRELGLSLGFNFD